MEQPTPIDDDVILAAAAAENQSVLTEVVEFLDAAHPGDGDCSILVHPLDALADVYFALAILGCAGELAVRTWPREAGSAVLLTFLQHVMIEARITPPAGVLEDFAALAAAPVPGARVA